MEFSSVDQLVPSNHLLRKVGAALNFDFIYSEVKDLYSEEIGRPSIDPVILIKIIMIQYLFGITSMRQTIKEIEVNIAYRWFLGYGLNDEIPHFSTFSENYVRRFQGTDLFEKIFRRILETAEANGLIHPEQVYIDATHIKANANKKKFTKVEIEIQARKYKDELETEINQDRTEHGKKPLREESEDSKKKLKL
jgi:transposase